MFFTLIQIILSDFCLFSASLIVRRINKASNAKDAASQELTKLLQEVNKASTRNCELQQYHFARFILICLIVFFQFVASHLFSRIFF